MTKIELTWQLAGGIKPPRFLQREIRDQRAAEEVYPRLKGRRMRGRECSRVLSGCFRDVSYLLAASVFEPEPRSTRLPLILNLVVVGIFRALERQKGRQNDCRP
jgi:hypothetical protein